MDRYTASVRRKYNRNALFYDVMDRMVRDAWRRTVVSQAAGRVLEVGVGTGNNLPFYDPSKVRSVTGVDISPGMLARARGKDCSVPRELLEMDAQNLSFEDDAFDTVLATCVFCTVPDPRAALQEVRRVCRPGGRILLLEHVRIDRPLVGTLMDVLDPVSVALIGTHINRRTVETVRRSGIALHRVDAIGGELVKFIDAGPNKPRQV